MLSIKLMPAEEARQRRAIVRRTTYGREGQDRLPAGARHHLSPSYVNAQAHDPDSVPGRLLAGLLNLIRVRKSSPVLHNFALFQPMWTDNEHVLAFWRRRHDGDLLLLANFDEHPQTVQDDLPGHAGIVGSVRDLLAEHTPVNAAAGHIYLEPYQTLWLTGQD